MICQEGELGQRSATTPAWAQRCGMFFNQGRADRQACRSLPTHEHCHVTGYGAVHVLRRGGAGAGCGSHCEEPAGRVLFYIKCNALQFPFAPQSALLTRQFTSYTALMKMTTPIRMRMGPVAIVGMKPVQG